MYGGGTGVPAAYIKDPGHSIHTSLFLFSKNKIGQVKSQKDLPKRSKNDREVVGPCVAKGTMLRWSDQLLLAAENHHFEGSTHLVALGLAQRQAITIISSIQLIIIQISPKNLLLEHLQDR